MPLARILRLLALTLWVGGLVFFAFVLAPVAFRVLPSTHLAGLVVAGTLGILHPMGEICGALFLIATLPLLRTASQRTRRLLLVQGALVVLMLAATFTVHLAIVPRMERDRIAAGGDVDAASLTDPARQDFQRLHPLSEKVEGTALLLGLAVVVLLALE